VLDEGYNYVMCHNSEEETSAHLFFSCPAAASSGLFWELLEENLSVHQKILQARPIFGHPFFMEIFMIAAWCIWKQRNDVIFEGKLHTLLFGRLFSKHLFWIISAESSHVFIPRSSSGLVLCNFPCSTSLLLCWPLSSLPCHCNLICCIFFASPSCCLITGWAGCRLFLVVTLFPLF
jgi:hypothetical protein